MMVPGWLQLVLPAICLLGAGVSSLCWFDARRRFQEGYWRKVTAATELQGQVWHGRCLHLQRVVSALAEGKREEGRRLLAQTGDEVLMRSLAAAAEKC
jgi:hypothetical protein